ncbi:MAG: lipase family protein [Bacteroidales bacterium]|jgi:hypothetical protein|nr:lipase family protein [Bacteroidales bacterium]
MKNSIACFLIIILLPLSTTLFAQNLSAGFNKQELLEVMYVSARTGGNEKYVNDSLNPIPKPKAFTRTYRSQAIAFNNLWELWCNNDNTAILTVRGSTAKSESWLTNFYAAMIPAKGEIIKADGEKLPYCFSEHPQAYVHAGWTISTSYLMQDIAARIDSIYKTGIKNLIITGHSQGGAIAYLLTAEILHKINTGRFPKDLQIKTYCTAAPRVGNLYFAYDFEQITQGGWAFNIINPLDWVPEMPLSVQTTEDFNSINPFAKVSNRFKREKLPKRIALKRIYKLLKKHPEKAVRNYQKILGEKLTPSVNKAVGEITLPKFANSMHYVRTGQSYVLQPNELYHKRFPHNPDKIFTHHSHHAYICLINQITD